MKKKLTTFVCLVALCGFVFSGCRKEEAPKPVEEGKELSNNPIAAMKQISDAAEKAAKAAKEMESQKPVEPVHFSKLIELLPAAPSGFEAQEPRGETTAAMGFKISQAERNYSKEGQDLEVTLMDGAFNAPIYAFVAMASQFSRESTEGYEKGVTIGENPGVEKWEKESKRGELSIVVNKRFVITIRASGVEPDFVRKVYSSIDVAKLAKLS
ncbi:MAG: hypothetical protein IT186_12570 [Acidobacteria bacterium]|nr:hypothetical protein [Acidobacteriota bacterium]MCG3194137.1 hypothetical protein [Thermoanaerobaculia bacterium]MCK6681063.1 hypothetical protein [Thermoanaerobaculia bacterium]